MILSFYERRDKMPKEDSYVHRQRNYWSVRYDAANSGAGERYAHVHISQGDRTISITVDGYIQNQSGYFSRKELEELIEIAKSYKNYYCLDIDANLFIDDMNLEELYFIKSLIMNISNEPKTKKL